MAVVIDASQRGVSAAPVVQPLFLIVIGRRTASTVLSAVAGRALPVYAGSSAAAAGGGRFAYTSTGKEEAPVASKRVASGGIYAVLSGLITVKDRPMTASKLGRISDVWTMT